MSSAVAGAAPRFGSPLPPDLAQPTASGLVIEDYSTQGKWRLVGGQQTVPLGRAALEGKRITFSVSPGEWIVIDEQNGTSAAVAPPSVPGVRVVDSTHLRAALRLTGDRAADVLARLCSLDITEQMFPSGGAARTLVAKVATEVVRLDRQGQRSYLLLASRSFGRYLYEAIADATG